MSQSTEEALAWAFLSQPKVRPGDRTGRRGLAFLNSGHSAPVCAGSVTRVAGVCLCMLWITVSRASKLYITCRRLYITWRL